MLVSTLLAHAGIVLSSIPLAAAQGAVVTVTQPSSPPAVTPYTPSVPDHPIGFNGSTIPKVLSTECVSKAKNECDDRIWPTGSRAALCQSASELPWNDPFTQMESKCYCDQKNVQNQWWDCFYTSVAACPATEETMRAIWDQEWNKYRYTRRLICLDDWKPNPPWTKIDNDFMKRHYDLGIPNQYSYEFAKY